ncbi:MAG: 3-isopropylmalate dehydratase large subunit [Acidobacteriia bacterium]|nr:3-isopropylmalate dehydratase large subunit [Terriglobia bacterium]
MSQTITEKILARHSGHDRVRANDLVNAQIDLIMCHDVTTPPAISMLKSIGVHRVFDPTRIVVTPDHFVPNKDIQSALLAKILRAWVEEQGIEHYYEIGRHGICHALLPEMGHILPGTTVIGADSHSTTYGAFGCFSTGIGSTDLAAALATGELWFKVPASMKIIADGLIPHGVFAKDIILEVIRQIGVDGARYMAMEWCGSTIDSLSMESRMTLTNMAVEAGAKSGIIAADETTRRYLAEKPHSKNRAFDAVQSDADAHYDQVVHIQVDQLEPMVALPHLPSNGVGISRVVKDSVVLDQAYIGSCTNARIEDLRVAAQVLKGRHVARSCRTMVVPATTSIYNQALREGLFEIFTDAGCAISTPTCGACLGGYMGVLAEGERCISTTNRNFVGRMGHPKSEVFLASPATVAASAIEGKIADPRKYLETP